MVLSPRALVPRLWYNPAALLNSPPLPEACLSQPLRHLPFALVLFIVLFSGLTDVAIGAEPRVLVTLLAPLMWLGLYVLGSERTRREDTGPC